MRLYASGIKIYSTIIAYIIWHSRVVAENIVAWNRQQNDLNDHDDAIMSTYYYDVILLWRHTQIMKALDSNY